MGLFSGSKKTVANTSFSRMIGDKDVKSVLQQAVANWIIADDDFISTVMSASTQALNRKLDRAYNWAKIPGNYYYGAPTPTTVTVDNATLLDYIQTYVQSNIGYSITRSYAELGSVNHYHMAWDFLITNHAYNPTTNQITSTLGVPIFVKDIVIHYYSDIMSRYNDAGLVPLGWAGTSGVTQSRSRDLTQPFPAYVIDATLRDYAQVTLTCRGTYTTTRTVVTRRTTVTPNAGGSSTVTNTTTSDNTVAGYDFTEPAYDTKTAVTLGVDASPAPTTVLVSSSNNGTNTTVIEDITTITVTVDTYDYDFHQNNSFLAYEFSGSAPVLNGLDTSNINPGAVAPAPSGTDYDWIVFGYTYVDGTGTTQIGYFTYALGSNLHPEIEATISALSSTGEFYPRLYARLNGTKLNDPSLLSSAAYKSSVKFAARLGLKYDKWVNDIHNNVGSLDKVWGIALGFEIPINTTNALEMEYLYKFFRREFNTLNPANVLPALIGIDGDILSSNTTFAISDAALTQTLSYEGIAKVTGTGSGFTPGSYSTTWALYAPVSHTFAGGRTAHSFTYYDTATTFTTYYILSVTSSSQVSGNFWSSYNQQAPDLMVPLDHALHGQMGLIKMEKLVQRSAQLIVNTLYDIKTKWYETGVFQVVLFIIVIIITVVVELASGGSATPGVAEMWSAFLTALTNAIITEVVVNVALRIAIALGLNPQLAAVIAVVAAVMAGQGEQIGSYLQTAKGILQVTNLALQTETKALGYELRTLNTKMSDLMKLEADEEANLQSKMEQLHTSNLVLSLDSIEHRMQSTLINLGEDPQSFYARTAVIDVSPIVYQQLLGYYATKLQVPNIQATSMQIGEENDGNSV